MSTSDSSRTGPISVSISRITDNGRARFSAISPDGRYLAYATDEGEKQSLWLRQVSTGSDINLLPAEESDYLGITFTPDAAYNSKMQNLGFDCGGEKQFEMAALDVSLAATVLRASLVAFVERFAHAMCSMWRRAEEYGRKGYPSACARARQRSWAAQRANHCTVAPVVAIL